MPIEPTTGMVHDRADAALAVQVSERAAGAVAAERALAEIDAGGGVWLGCDVQAPGLFRIEAKAAVEPLLAFYLDGCVMRVVPHGDVGRALAARLHPTALAGFQSVQGRLERRFAPGTGRPHPVIEVLRSVLAAFGNAPPTFGLYGTLAFDYYRLAQGDALPDDGRRRLALFLPARVLCIEESRQQESRQRWLHFDFPGLTALPAPPGQAAQIDAVQPQAFEDDLPVGGHAKAVARGVEHLRRGELCSLVLSQCFRRRVTVNAPQAFARLRRDNPYPAMFFAHLGGGEKVFGASPDVQVRADAQWVETAPVCGTFRRGADAVDDHEQAKALINSRVDEAALALCADSDRNDKALVCEPGSVELLSRRRVHFFSTILHTIDHTRGRRRAGVDGFDIVLAHATPATVTGMPKALARETIAALEASPRGWYAGAAVRIGADGSCEALTMLRFARLIGDVAEVRTGGNLLADSDPVREEEETRLKAETMFRVLAGHSPRAQAAPATPPTRVAAQFIDGGDALGALAREALVQAGCEFADAAALRVLGDGPLQHLLSQAADTADDRPTLALNNAALSLWHADGAALERLDPPQFGRALGCSATAGGVLQAMGSFSVGVHATHVVHNLPAGWQLAARGDDGRVIAALHPLRRIVALAFRPDSVLSLRRSAGVTALRAALDWLSKPTA
ncbi:MAG: chorismate-binding protein [Rubrivivax sp.]